MGTVRKSWVADANAPDSPFPLQNLPYGVYLTPEGGRHCCIAIGENIVDLTRLEAAGRIDLGRPQPLFGAGSLNRFMAEGDSQWQRLRRRLTDLLAEDGDPALRDDAVLLGTILRPRAGLTMLLPFEVAEYTDFYAGRQHAENAGSILRGDASLPLNWLSMPVGYNGRASSVIVGGTDIRRPLGQMKSKNTDLDADLPVFGATRQLDFELEIGAVVGQPSPMGQPVTVAAAEDMIFGFVLLNDWSARDIQAWESRPLGPFQAKAFATSISPWIVTREALAPFRVPTPTRQRPLLPYLREPGPMLYDITLEVVLEPEGVGPATTICRTNYREMYYSAPQLLAHHAVSGCGMRTGDLLGSGTISGPTEDSFGSLLELSRGKTKPLRLASGGTRCFLEDGDRLVLRGYADGGEYRIGFGDCAGRVLPAPAELAW
jgi:fumarylacetoacetase